MDLDHFYCSWGAIIMYHCDSMFHEQFLHHWSLFLYQGILLKICMLSSQVHFWIIFLINYKSTNFVFLFFQQTFFSTSEFYTLTQFENKISLSFSPTYCQAPGPVPGPGQGPGQSPGQGPVSSPWSISRSELRSSKFSVKFSKERTWRDTIIKQATPPPHPTPPSNFLKLLP